MPLDPQAQAYLEQLKQMGIDYASLSPTTARTMHAQILSVRPPGEAVANVEDRLIPGPAGQVPIRIYTPQGSGPFPVLVFLPTGAWVLGTPEIQDPLCRRITNRARCLVVSVNYRLAPENPFPAALEDCYAATQWVAAHAAGLGGDPSRIAIGGDSAGGNMATVVTLLARDRSGPKLAFQLLLFPATDFTFSTPVMQEPSEGYNVTREEMLWIRKNYVPNEADWTNPLASPLFARDLSNLPPALIITAEYDQLRDEGELYAKCLQEAGVPAKVSRYNGMIHDFQDLFEEPGNRVVDEIAAALRAAFA